MVYREGLRWFIDDNGRFPKAENELVAGIPNIILKLVGKVNQAKVTARDNFYEGFLRLVFFCENSNGFTYSIITERGAIKEWLSPAFWHYFEKIPIELYINVKAINAAP